MLIKKGCDKINVNRINITSQENKIYSEKQSNNNNKNHSFSKKHLEVCVRQLLRQENSYFAFWPYVCVSIGRPAVTVSLLEKRRILHVLQ